MQKIIEKIKNYFNAKDYDKYDDLPIDEQYYRLRIHTIKEAEKASRWATFFVILAAIVISISFIIAGVNAMDELDSEVTASAAEENVISSPDSANIVPLAPGAVLIYEDYEEELIPLWSYSGNYDSIDLSSLNLTEGVYQVVCKAYNGIGEVIFLTNLAYIDTDFPSQAVSLTDYGWGDVFFTVVLADDYLSYDFYNSFASDEGAYVVFYALYKIEDSSSDESISDSFFGAISDGVTFGFDAIPSGITYIFDELFVHEGKLTTYSYAVFSLCGVAIVLGLIKFLLSYLFSLGGK